MKRFLLAKHWQLFTLMFGAPFIFYIFMMVDVFSAATSGNPANMLGVFKFFPLLMILFVGIQFGWFWSVGVGLQYKIPEAIKMKVKKFKVFFFIPLVYIFLIMCVVALVFSSMAQGSGLFSGTNNPAVFIIPFVIIFPLHLFSMFCIFYCLYFTAKTLKTAEMQKEVSFGDFAGEFFLIWFYPIGIWFIQPRINKLVEAEEDQAATSMDQHLDQL